MRARSVLIGLENSNRYDKDHPFTPMETTNMIRLILQKHSNYHISEIPEVADKSLWTAMVCDLFGPLDILITASCRADLLRPHYRIVHPFELLPDQKELLVTAAQVRQAMLNGNAWKHMVPHEIALFIEEWKLADRLRKEFSL